MTNLHTYQWWRRIFRILTAMTLLGISSLVFILFFTPSSAPQPATLSLQEAMSDQTTEQFAKVTQPRPFIFPDDHGLHPDVKTEWWYFTGNLTDSTGRRFGYQLTFFRSGLRYVRNASDTSTMTRRSGWNTNDFYMAHFAFSDIDRKEFHAFEEFARPQNMLAGVALHPFRVWLGKWRVESQTPFSFFPLRLHAVSPDHNIALTLFLDSLKPLVLQGKQGFSQKSADSGNASYYYSFPRFRSTGSISIGSRTYTVQGLSWFDREWSTSALARNQVGWDWFSLQFDTMHELMLYRLRNTSGATDAKSIATLIAPDGTTQSVPVTDSMLTALTTMTVRSGTTYPREWHIHIPELSFDCIVTPQQEEQELPFALRYWEGAVYAKGTIRARTMSGTGYVEMTGYKR